MPDPCSDSPSMFSSCMYPGGVLCAGAEGGPQQGCAGPQQAAGRPVAAVAARPRGEKSRSGKKTAYKHVPHRDKPPQLVARRNARERRRVQAVNSAFARLSQAVPNEGNRGKRVSKVKTLQRAIEYICLLQGLLLGDGQEMTSEQRWSQCAYNSSSKDEHSGHSTNSQTDNSFEEFLEDFDDHF